MNAVSPAVIDLFIAYYVVDTEPAKEMSDPDKVFEAMFKRFPDGKR